MARLNPTFALEDIKDLSPEICWSRTVKYKGMRRFSKNIYWGLDSLGRERSGSVGERERRRSSYFLYANNAMADAIRQKLLYEGGIKRGSIDIDYGIKRGSIDTGDAIKRGSIDTSEGIKRGSIDTSEGIKRGSIDADMMPIGGFVMKIDTADRRRSSNLLDSDNPQISIVKQKALNKGDTKAEEGKKNDSEKMGMASANVNHGDTKIDERKKSDLEKKEMDSARVNHGDTKTDEGKRSDLEMEMPSAKVETLEITTYPVIKIYPAGAEDDKCR